MPARIKLQKKGNFVLKDVFNNSAHHLHICVAEHDDANSLLSTECISTSIYSTPSLEHSLDRYVQGFNQIKNSYFQNHSYNHYNYEPFSNSKSLSSMAQILEIRYNNELDEYVNASTHYFSSELPITFKLLPDFNYAPSRSNSDEMVEVNPYAMRVQAVTLNAVNADTSQVYFEDVKLDFDNSEYLYRFVGIPTKSDYLTILAESADNEKSNNKGSIETEKKINVHLFCSNTFFDSNIEINYENELRKWKDLLDLEEDKNTDKNYNKNYNKNLNKKNKNNNKNNEQSGNKKSSDAEDVCNISENNNDKTGIHSLEVSQTEKEIKRDCSKDNDKESKSMHNASKTNRFGQKLSSSRNQFEMILNETIVAPSRLYPEDMVPCKTDHSLLKSKERVYNICDIMPYDIQKSVNSHLSKGSIKSIDNKHISKKPDNIINYDNTTIDQSKEDTDVNKKKKKRKNRKKNKNNNINLDKDIDIDAEETNLDHNHNQKTQKTEQKELEKSQILPLNNNNNIAKTEIHRSTSPRLSSNPGEINININKNKNSNLETSKVDSDSKELKDITLSELGKKKRKKKRKLREKNFEISLNTTSYTYTREMSEKTMQSVQSSSDRKQRVEIDYNRNISINGNRINSIAYLGGYEEVNLSYQRRDKGDKEDKEGDKDNMEGDKEGVEFKHELENKDNNDCHSERQLLDNFNACHKTRTKLIPNDNSLYNHRNQNKNKNEYDSCLPCHSFQARSNHSSPYNLNNQYSANTKTTNTYKHKYNRSNDTMKQQENGYMYLYEKQHESNNNNNNNNINYDNILSYENPDGFFSYSNNYDDNQSQYEEEYEEEQELLNINIHDTYSIDNLDCSKSKSRIECRSASYGPDRDDSAFSDELIPLQSKINMHELELSSRIHNSEHSSSVKRGEEGRTEDSNYNYNYNYNLCSNSNSHTYIAESRLASESESDADAEADVENSQQFYREVHYIDSLHKYCRSRMASNSDIDVIVSDKQLENTCSNCEFYNKNNFIIYSRPEELNQPDFHHSDYDKKNYNLNYNYNYNNSSTLKPIPFVDDVESCEINDKVEKNKKKEKNEIKYKYMEDKETYYYELGSDSEIDDDVRSGENGENRLSGSGYLYDLNFEDNISYTGNSNRDADSCLDSANDELDLPWEDMAETDCKSVSLRGMLLKLDTNNKWALDWNAVLDEIEEPL